MNGLLTHTRFSLESGVSSRPSTTSSRSISTTAAASTIRGLGSNSSRLVYAVGEAVLQGMELLVIRKKLAVVVNAFPHKDKDVQDLTAIYEDILELARYVILFDYVGTAMLSHHRPGLYPLSIIRKHALQVLLAQIATYQTARLIDHILHRPSIENSLLLSEVMLCLPINWYALWSICPSPI